MTQEQILFFEESYTKYYRMMVQTVLPIVGSRDIAEDIVADTFLILLAKINSVMEHEQPVKWLFRVLKNNAISEYRAQCRHAAAPLEESILRAAEPELIPFSGMLPKGLSESEQRILTLRIDVCLHGENALPEAVNLTVLAPALLFQMADRLRRHLLHGIAQPEPEGVELEPVHMLQHAGGRMGKIRHQIRRKEPIERRAPKGSTAELLHQLVLRGLHTRGHFR